ncbi:MULTISPECIES: glycoside hydrolase family 2 protein [unclassified Cryobacterium]|uniref:glycoside hydrolase family 2 protein n=2 Tax=unclassified Cryobacterium TaxID=2649013 RepID=UPI002AB564A4|nr:MULTISPECIES: sugar-binding domain-containing protein [unclassified Cryobacterium]MDY7544456.1 glycoside hydrolase family 2 TIM barrel-domain containing protein [Cryobacterium sp. 5B3]MEB0000300.1 glycoside hydrolase family 2 TIM barrel-domain containing protein [Cryobacterium sp. RTS3]
MTILTPKGSIRMSSELPSVPKPEYPRPDFDRSDRWESLNGQWAFSSLDGEESITVPFAWETEASGIARTWLEQASYSRELTVPHSWAGARVFVCFGAVHHETRVSIGGAKVGEHTGGYTSFEFDITDYLAVGSSATLRVDVTAPSDKRSIPHGKQRSLPRDDYDGVSFMASSGIWQSVWIEARGRTYAESVSLRGDSLTGFEVTVQVAGDEAARARVSIGDLEVVTDEHGRASGFLPIDSPHLWSPIDPHLYALDVRVGDDLVVVTGGLRSIERLGEDLYLNGERFYLRGVLDQGYWSTSGITAPNDAALVHDLDLARQAGFNLVRKHLKFEEPRWLHWADTLGMLVWAEPASTSRFSEEATVNFEAQIPEMVKRDGNHPSIIIWGLYNEEWGLNWDIPGDPAKADAARRAYDQLAALDHSRPIVENSGWEHVKTDLMDWHYYDENPASWAANVAAIASGERESFPVPLGPTHIVDKSIYGDNEQPRSGVPLLNSEFGGGFTSLERAWHVRWQTQEIRRHDRFAGYVYTELADVEHESAGLFTADRKSKDLGGLDPADANAETVIVVGLVPREAGTDIATPTVPLILDVRVSHHGRKPLTGQVRAAWVQSGTPFGPNISPSVTEAPVLAHPFQISDAVKLSLPAPAMTSARLHLWIVDEQGAIKARTFVDAGPLERDAP